MKLLKEGAWVIEHLRSKDRKRQEKAYQYLYEKEYENVKYYVLKNGGGIEDVKDVFIQAISILYTRYKPGGSIGSYLMNTAKNIWKNELRRKSYEKRANIRINAYPTIIESNEIQLQEDKVEAEYLELVVKKCLHSLKEKCIDLLKKFYFEKMSYAEILGESIEASYTNNQYDGEIINASPSEVNKLKAQKHRCLEHLRKCVRQYI